MGSHVKMLLVVLYQSVCTYWESKEETTEDCGNSPSKTYRFKNKILKKPSFSALDFPDRIPKVSLWKQKEPFKIQRKLSVKSTHIPNGMCGVFFLSQSYLMGLSGVCVCVCALMRMPVLQVCLKLAYLCQLRLGQ